MKTIHKYDLEAKDRQVILMPKGAVIIGVDGQDTTGRTVQVWAIVDPNEPHEVEREFVIVGTGHSLPTDVTVTTHLATVVTAGGALVWHVFEVR